MADAKISALATATTPLAGTEAVPVVQSSTTKQVAVSDLTAGRAVSAASLVTTGVVGVGATPGTGVSFAISKTISGAATSVSSYNVGVIQSGVSSAYYNRTEIGTAAAAFTVSTAYGYQARQGTVGAGSSITFQYGFSAGANLYGATDNYGFFAEDTGGANATTGKLCVGYRSAITAASGGGTTYNFWASGTAPNVFSGDVQINGAGILGYRSGSGGTVTQITSRTTGVTIDKTNGAITLVSAAGTTTWQTFIVTNNKVAATDVIIVNQKSGTDLNEIHVTAVAAGSFNISFRTTGGTTTETPVFSFAVIKAATA